MKKPRMTKKFLRRIASVFSVQPEIIEPGSWVGDCDLCGKEDSVGVLVANFNSRLGSPTCFGGRICSACERELAKVRNRFKQDKTPQEKKHEREYRKFLRGEVYPEVVCEHRPVSGVVAKARLKSNAIYKGSN